MPPRPEDSARPGQAQDFLADLNVLSVVVELPRASLGGGVIRLWETTSILSATDFKYHQQDRLARPAVNEVLATVSNLRHHVNNMDNPTDDSSHLKTDIESFMTFPAGRSTAIKNAIDGGSGTRRHDRGPVPDGRPCRLSRRRNARACPAASSADGP